MRPGLHRSKPPWRRLGLAGDPCCGGITLHIDIVRECQDTERPAIFYQVLSRYARNIRGSNGPTAHFLTDMYPMMHNVGLCRIGQQYPIQNPLSLFQTAELLK